MAIDAEQKLREAEAEFAEIDRRRAIRLLELEAIRERMGEILKAYGRPLPPRNGDGELRPR